MKRTSAMLLMLFGTMVLIALPLTASATPFTFSQSQMLSMVESFDNPVGIGDLDSKTALPNEGVLFVGDINDGNPQWRSIGIGFPWGNPNLPGDLSAFTGYGETFTNVNNQNWWVNLYTNTGWTDAPWSESNNFYQNGWINLAPLGSATLTIDFAGLGVEHLNHVTNIGFQFAFNDPTVVTLPSGIPGFQGDKYHIEVTPIPEPATMLLLGSGLIGLAGFVRRKTKRR